MSLFEETVARIGGLDRRAMKEASGALWEALPEAERLGALRKILLRFVGVTGNTEPAALRAAVIMCCADHGVSAQQVSAFVPETSVQMVRNYLLHRGAAANVFADFAQAELLVVDMGLAEAAAVPGVIDRHVARGTQDMTQGPAMTREQALQSVYGRWGELHSAGGYGRGQYDGEHGDGGGDVWAGSGPGHRNRLAYFGGTAAA